MSILAMVNITYGQLVLALCNLSHQLFNLKRHPHDVVRKALSAIPTGHGNGYACVSWAPVRTTCGRLTRSAKIAVNHY